LTQNFPEDIPAGCYDANHWLIANGKKPMPESFDEEPLTEQKEAVGAALPEFFDEKGRFLHNVLGDYLIENYGCCKINGAVHIFDNGIYRPGEDALYGVMIDLLPKISDARRRETFKYIKCCRRTPTREPSPPHLIPFQHQIYNLRTGEFLDYSPEFVFLNRFPWDYNPEAPACKTVADTLSAIAGSDVGVLSLLLEAFGNCFYMLNQYRGAVMLYGPSGSNGKSTLLNMLVQMVGEENCAFLSLQDTAEKFRLIGIYGKAVNIGDDVSDAYFTDSSPFKKLVTGERVKAEKKGQDPIDFKSYAKLFFSLNSLPPIRDKTAAMFSRLLIVPMNADFSTVANRDVSLKDRQWSREEMEYLTCLAMDGLKRLTAQGDFTRPACVQQIMARYQMENDPVMSFLAEYRDPTNMPTQMLYDDFRNWCQDNGHRKIPTQNTVSREVCRLYALTIKNKRTEYSNRKVMRCFVADE